MIIIYRRGVNMDKETYNKTLELYKKFYEDGNKQFRGMYMSDMERLFNIPLLNNEKFNEANPEVMELYLKFAGWEIE